MPAQAKPRVANSILVELTLTNIETVDARTLLAHFEAENPDDALLTAKTGARYAAVLLVREPNKDLPSDGSPHGNIDR